MEDNYTFASEGKARYREENGTYCIDIFLMSSYQLFDRRDPSPFREKDLDEDFIDFLILAMGELSEAEHVKLVVKMPEHNPVYLKAHDIEEAIYNFFSFEVETTKNELKSLFRQGRWSFVMAFSFLTLCYATAYFIGNNFPGVLPGALREGLTVCGWVALWRPINLFLYEWLPFHDKIKLYKRLQKLKVEIITG